MVLSLVLPLPWVFFAFEIFSLFIFVPISVTKTISSFLARNRARNDASNRQEFLLSLAEKRQRLGQTETSADPGPSCARTDAKTQNRDIQMKYDIAKNEDGPLRKTLKTSMEPGKISAPPTSSGDNVPTSERYPALDERLKNVETHLAVKYGMSTEFYMRSTRQMMRLSTFTATLVAW